jgi:hypothetical protein
VGLAGVANLTTRKPVVVLQGAEMNSANPMGMAAVAAA